MLTQLPSWIFCDSTRRFDCAVVPCRLFPERRLHGEPVITHAQLVEYLGTKASATRVVRLLFEGQNHCVYTPV